MCSKIGRKIIKGVPEKWCWFTEGRGAVRESNLFQMELYFLQRSQKTAVDFQIIGGGWQRRSFWFAEKGICFVQKLFGWCASVEKGCLYLLDEFVNKGIRSFQELPATFSLPYVVHICSRYLSLCSVGIAIPPSAEKEDTEEENEKENSSSDKGSRVL